MVQIKNVIKQYFWYVKYQNQNIILLTDILSIGDAFDGFQKCKVKVLTDVLSVW